MYEDGDGEMMRKMELFGVGGEQVAMSQSGVAIVDGEDGAGRLQVGSTVQVW